VHLQGFMMNQPMLMIEQ